MINFLMDFCMKPISRGFGENREFSFQKQFLFERKTYIRFHYLLKENVI